MRRKDREITDQQIIEEILQRNEVGRLAMCLDHIPYIVPVNFAHQGNAIYFHSASMGKKLEIIKENPYVCFETDENKGVIRDNLPCEWGYRFSSVIAQGKAEILHDVSDKIDALNLIMLKHGGTSENQFPEKMLARTTVVKITCDHFSGKQGNFNE